MLEQIKALLNIRDASKDGILNTLIAICSSEYKELTHVDVLNQNCVVRMVMHRYSILGSEGISGESFAGTSFSYEKDYPEDLLKLISTHRKVRTL